MSDRRSELRLTALALSVFAILLLPGAAHAVQLWPPVWSNPPETPIPGVEHHTFHSSSLDSEVGYNVLLPPGYSSSDRRYPVLYWLHGIGGNESANARALAPMVIEALAERVVPPMIVVFVNGGAATFYADSPDGSVPAETMFISELIPHIDATYRTVADRRNRAIEGMSMGGFGALAQAMKHVDLFGSVVAYAPALLVVQETEDGSLTLARAGGTHDGSESRLLPVEIRTRVFVEMFGGQPEVYADHSPWSLVRRGAVQLRTELSVRIIIGTADGLWNANQLFHELLLEQGYGHEFEVVEGVAHNIGALYEAVGVEGLVFHAREGGWR